MRSADRFVAALLAMTADPMLRRLHPARTPARARARAGARDRAAAGRRRAGAAGRRGRARDPHAHQRPAGTAIGSTRAMPGCRWTSQWQLPQGFAAGPLRYPVPTPARGRRADELRLRARLCGAGAAEGAGRRARASSRSAPTRTGSPAPTRSACPSRASCRSICRSGAARPTARSSTNGAARCRGRSPASAHFAVRGDKLRVAIPLPASVDGRRALCLSRSPTASVDYDAPQSFRRAGDTLVAELPAQGRRRATHFAGVLALGDGRGLRVHARARGRSRRRHADRRARRAARSCWAVLGAIVGGILLNLMPCVFPILALKALHLSRAGGEAREARRDALAYTAGAVVGTGALGALLLAIRAGGSEAGWAFQLQDPRTIMLLLLLATAITANLLGLFELPVLGGERAPAGSFGDRRAGRLRRDALRRAVPRRGARHRAAAAARRDRCWCSPRSGSGSRCRSCSSPSSRRLRTRLPKPGPWMKRLQRFLAIPMAASAVACLWLLYRQAGDRGAGCRLVAAAALAGPAVWFGRPAYSAQAGAARLGDRCSSRSSWSAAPCAPVPASPAAAARASPAPSRGARRAVARARRARPSRCSSISPPTGA